MRLAPGSSLGPYEIVAPLGAGGMGEVYRARDTRLGREVAIKILPREVAADAERIARFRREASAASALNHPNIVTVHDFTSHEGETWLVMELIRGTSLRDLMLRGPLKLRKLAAIATGIADGLAAAHAAGLVHRDLKPENVMITGDGVAKILDFGLVKTVPAGDFTDSPTEQHVSRAGTTVGTAAYMSPEQARGVAVDFRSDHFALGLILYEMATGTHPFRRETSFETLTAILNDDAPPLGRDVPEPLQWIIERCLAKDPAERYGSTTDLARDLARLRDRSSSDLVAISAPRAARRAWWSAAALALLAIAAVAAIAWSVRRRPAGIDAPIQTEVALPELHDIAFDEVATPIAISPDGRYLVVNGVDAIGTRQLWLRDLRSGSTRLIATQAFAPAWSSDGKEIAFFAEGKLKAVEVAGGPARTICDSRPEGTPWWEGDTILFAQYSRDRGLYRVSARGGQPALVMGPTLKPRYSLPFWPQLLPDDQGMLFIALHPDAEGRSDLTRELKLAPSAGGSPRTFPEVGSRAVLVDETLLFVRDGTLVAQEFDSSSGLKGQARPVIEDLHYFRSTGLAAFSVSRNGILAWRARRPEARLVWLDRAGMELETIGSAVFDANGRLSADGKRYVVGVVDPKQGISDLWVYDFERQSSERATFSMVDEKAPIWANDGRTIYYRSDGGSGPPDIWVLRPGEHRGAILYRGPTVEEPKDVSPDGKWLLYASFFIEGSDVHARPVDGQGKSREIAATPFNETSPRFSPDGKWVAYSSDLSGRPEIYVRPFADGGAAVRLSRDGGTRPRWRRDGKELYYLGPEGRVMVIAVEGSFAAPRLLFHAPTAADFEPAPDGTRFLAQLQPRSTAPAVRLLVNWPRRLEQ